MYPLYRFATGLSGPLLRFLLKRRLTKGKEESARLNERMGKSLITRPAGHLIWMHGASVGEVNSLLGLILKFRARDPECPILITSGTVTSAKLLKDRLPEGVIHQYIPLDHPKWIAHFFDHWKPSLAIFAESEIWPNILMEMQKRKLRSVLINARLSEKSFNQWKKLPRTIEMFLASFKTILTQTETDTSYYNALGHKNVVTSGNIKYSAEPLPYESHILESLKHKFKDRKIWVYASSHADEELIACRIHKNLSKDIPNLLTLIVPRHPERRHDIAKQCEKEKHPVIFRSAMHTPPEDCSIYIIDTLGELGLFYSLSDIAMIGRTLSLDGGGGHNPIEAAQLNCAVLHGPNYQNQQDIFDDMHLVEAAQKVSTAEALEESIKAFFTAQDALELAQKNALRYTQSKDDILEHAFNEIVKLLPDQADKKV